MKNKFHFFKCFEILPHISKTWKPHNLHPNIHYFMTNKTRVWKELTEKKKISIDQLFHWLSKQNTGIMGTKVDNSADVINTNTYITTIYIKDIWGQKKNHLKFSFSGQKFQNILWQADILFLKQLSFFLIWLIMEKMSHFPF